MDDLANLVSMSEESLNGELRARYALGKIYTYVGDILVAVNPYENLPIYAPADQAKYRGVRKPSPTVRTCEFHSPQLPRAL